MTQTRLQGHLDHLWANSTSSAGKGPRYSHIPKKERLSYLNLSGEALALVAPVGLSEALSHLSGLVHPQEPEVTGVDVPDSPQVTDVRWQVLALLVVWL